MQNSKIYALDEEHWQKYLKGRPQLPDKFFDRIAKYHASHGGSFDTVHDVGAGVGVQSPRLAKFFKHVIVSDIVPDNVKLAEKRLGTEGYSFHAATIEDASFLEPGSVDMVFAAFAMHHSHFDEAFQAIARQLKSGGTFVAVICARARFEDAPDVQRVYDRMWYEGQRVLVRNAKDRKARLRTLGHGAGRRDTMPLSEEFFQPGALRIAVNGQGEEWPFFIPQDVQEEFDAAFGGESAVGPHDRVIFEQEDGWGWEADIQFIKDEYATLPWAVLEPSTFEPMLKELEDLFSDGRKVRGVYPARINIATRK